MGWLLTQGLTGQCGGFAQCRRECGKLLDCLGNRAAGAELEAIGEVRER